jgi:uncharacterized damage-inducible protein DinB
VTAFSLLARNNAWANARLLGICATLPPGEWHAPRTGFFPSLRATIEHIHAIDLYYLDAACEGGEGRRLFHTAPHFPTPQEASFAMAAQDARLITFCDSLDAPDTARRVPTERGPGIVMERLDHLLLHLFQHQIHHRGQAHAMLSSTPVAPPQLDEFFLDYDRHPSALPWLE